MRRSSTILASVGVAAVVAVATLPWWLGAAAGLIAPQFGLTFSDYERIGYSKFKLENVEVRRPGVYVQIDEAEAETPLVWLWRRATGNPSEVVGGAWRVEVDARAIPSKPEKPRGWVPLTQTLRRTAERLDRWLPRAKAGPGVVTWRNGELTLGPAGWRERTLTASKVGFKALEAAGRFTLSEDGKMRLELDAPQNDGSAVLEAEGAKVAGEVTWWGVKTVASAQFSDTGWRPLVANFRADAWEIPGSRAK
ncbi:MAG TPA: hypothetical protein VEA63_15375, partial [Opitutus sp.]|nr:hypothetical protein [Opitutus sp.]